MKNSTHLFALLFFCTVIFISACEQSRVFDKNNALEKDGWYYGDKESFEVSILDTAISYNLYINVRHTDQYPNNNIWLNMTTIFPDSSIQQNKISIILSEPQGDWTGICVDGICFNSVLMQSNFNLNQKGTYIFELEQDMRINPLPHILSIGLKLEKFGVDTF